MAKILGWDLETTNLDADFGFIICGGVKELGCEPELYAVTDYKLFKKNCTNDKAVCKTLAKRLSEADVWITWYGTYFDIPYLNSRLLYHGEKPLPPIPHVDGWRIARNRLKIHSNRLDSVSKFLRVSEKTPILQEHWRGAAAGRPQDIAYVIKHCKQDLVVLEEVYETIKGLCRDHPNVSITSDNSSPGCPVCGRSDTLTKRGFSVARTFKRQRFQCSNCGAWSVGKPVRVPNTVAY